MPLGSALQGFFTAQQQGNQQDDEALKQAGAMVALHSAIQKEKAAAGETGRNEALRAAILKLPPEQRTRENVLPLLMQYGNVKEMVPLLKTAEKAYSPVGAGGVIDNASGEVIPPAGLERKPPNVRQRYDGETVIQEEQQKDGSWKEIGRGPRFAKTVEPVGNSVPVTTAEVIDPTDPTRMLKIDARTYRGGSIGSPGVLGVSGNVSAREKLEIKRQFNMQGIGKVIQEAEDILGGKNGDALPTQSGVGTGVDYLSSLVGYTPSGAPQADRLRAIGGALTAKMPRMEGPQSDRDVVLYREMAARVGDSMLPIERRKAALETVKDLWAKYERLNPDAFAGASPANAAPGGGTPAPAPRARFQEGQTATGRNGEKIIFKGGQWQPMTSQ